MDLATANDVLAVLVATGRAQAAEQWVPWVRGRCVAERTMAKINTIF